MIRIRGTLGPWPVDLEIELDAADWQQLAAAVVAPAPAEPPPPRPAATRDDAQWASALALVQQAGEVSGPALMEQLEALAGSAAAAKRVLVRLRHCAQVRIRTEADAPVYCWVG